MPNVKQYLRLVARNLIEEDLDGCRHLYDHDQDVAWTFLTPEEQAEAKQLVQDIFEEFL